LQDWGSTEEITKTKGLVFKMHMCLFTLSGIEGEKETMMGVDVAQKGCAGLPCREFLLKCLVFYQNTPRELAILND
jgi:hypothetical protein